MQKPEEHAQTLVNGFCFLSLKGFTVQSRSQSQGSALYLTNTRIRQHCDNNCNYN
ncbi:hypothetical protein DPMN_109430 [Dreissena polymorpha]|uniref:Uncharacterized protein n=1 Tax=Dreissena polymorpha TaxID=45954 RepID=A0A9D4KAJ9_DREPO|nr:hypothetical protein DPMN_109430 [Dreissena polymorpha]